MRSNSATINTRAVPIIVVLAFILIMLGYSQTARMNETKDGNRDLTTSYPKQAYQANYEQRTETETGVMTIYSDGLGHVRVESNFQNSKNPQITIYDFPAKKKSFLQEWAKTYMVSGMSSLGMGFLDEEMFKSTEAESLGVRNINNRPCDGYKSTLLGEGNSEMESWFDQATGCLMQSKTKVISYALTHYAGKPQRPQLFEVPKDYKEIPLGF